VKRFLIILLLITSCSISNKKSASGPLHYFACAEWVDYNHDGKYDYNEFKNIKNTFISTEEVLFVGYFAYPPAGSILRFRLFAPDGSLVHEITQTQFLRKALPRSKYSVGELITGKAAGIWEGVWDVDDDVVAGIEVNFIY
jgi:hypothetical protein